jgi:hypothetical protein
VSVPCRRLRASDATPEYRTPRALHLRETVGTAAAAVEILSLLPPLGLTVAGRRVGAWGLGPGFRPHFCRISASGGAGWRLAPSSSWSWPPPLTMHHMLTRCPARHPQTIGGWGHRSGGHQQCWIYRGLGP